MLEQFPHSHPLLPATMELRPVIIALVCIVAMCSATFLPGSARASHLGHQSNQIELTGNETYIWGRCINVPVLGNCCAEIFADSTNLTLTIALLIRGTVVHTEVLSAGQLCLTQDEVHTFSTSDLTVLAPEAHH